MDPQELFELFCQWLPDLSQDKYNMEPTPNHLPQVLWDRVLKVGLGITLEIAGEDDPAAIKVLLSFGLAMYMIGVRDGMDFLDTMCREELLVV